MLTVPNLLVLGLYVKIVIMVSLHRSVQTCAEKPSLELSSIIHVMIDGRNRYLSKYKLLNLNHFLGVETLRN